MIGFDGEWGLDMRLKNTYRFPWNMTLGAIQDNQLIFQLGKHIGQHCNRLGIHVNFAPVVDINTNPQNPIIGNRSFGEDKKNVTQKSIAFIQGLQSEGVYGTVKHFPGHGDTATDSPLGLPVLNFNKKQLEDIELYPYQKVFNAGVAGVMTAHLSIPALEKNPKLPTSLSPSVVNGLLKEKLGFLGLIFTDGLNMKGAANYATSAQINLAALQAGNDILLIPQDIPATVTLIKKSLKRGKLSIHSIDKSVKKILSAKYKLGLHQYQAIDTTNLIADVNTTSDGVLHRSLVEASMTVIKNKKEVLPIKDLKKYQKIAYLELGDASGGAFLNTLKKYTKVVRVSGSQLNKVKKTLKNYDLVIIGYHTSNKHPWKSFKFSKKDLLWLDEIGKSNKVILSVFASPYSLLDVNSFANIEGILIGYQNIRCKKFDDLHLTLNMDIRRKIKIDKSGVQEHELLHYIKHSSVFIYPSLFEGFGIPPLEAAALGSKVICSNLSAMSNFNFFIPYHIEPKAKNLIISVNKIIVDRDKIRIKKSVVLVCLSYTLQYIK